MLNGQGAGKVQVEIVVRGDEMADLIEARLIEKETFNTSLRG